MTSIEAFEMYADEYDAWFQENANIYLSELNAVKEFIPPDANGVEIGVGSGKFAIPLGITTGIEPSAQMAKRSRKQGIHVIEAFAEDLPLVNESFDFVLMVTAVCFFDDIEKAFREAYRVLKPGGRIIIAHIDKNSPLGQLYQIGKENSKFYRDARFFSVDELTRHLQKAGFSNYDYRQTVFSYQNDTVQAVKPGFGEGSFVVIKAVKPRKTAVTYQRLPVQATEFFCLCLRNNRSGCHLLQLLGGMGLYLDSRNNLRI